MSPTLNKIEMNDRNYKDFILKLVDRTKLFKKEIRKLKFILMENFGTKDKVQPV